MARTRIAPDWEVWRLRFVHAAMLLSLVGIAIRLWVLQTSLSQRFIEDQTRQSVRRVRVPGTRGLICDRQGVPLAENRPSFDLALNLEELRPARRQTRAARVREAIAEIEQRIGVKSTLTTNELASHLEKRLPMPLVAWKDLPEDAVARWAERASNLPGVDLYPQAVRDYPHGTSTCHVVGYVGRADADNAAHSS